MANALSSKAFEGYVSVRAVHQLEDRKPPLQDLHTACRCWPQVARHPEPSCHPCPGLCGAQFLTGATSCLPIAPPLLRTAASLTPSSPSNLMSSQRWVTSLPTLWLHLQVPSSCLLNITGICSPFLHLKTLSQTPITFKTMTKS